MGQLKLDLVSKIPKVDFEYGLDGSYSPIYLQKPVYDYTTLPCQSKTTDQARRKTTTRDKRRKIHTISRIPKKNRKAEHD